MQFKLSVPGQSGQVPGSVDYRFVRRRTLTQFKNGEVDASDICDAQPELMRVANNYSQKSTVACPVCGARSLRIVKYVFGYRLPAQGRVVATRSELRSLSTLRGDRKCFTVEVCTECRWNHLLDIVPLRRSSDEGST